MTPRVDAHHHFWDIESGDYGWPTPAEGPIYRTFEPADLEPEIRDSRIDRTVLVQTVNTRADTASMLTRATAHEWIGAVVGWVPLWDLAAAAALLDGWAGSHLRGIRHLIHMEPDPDWLLRADVGGGLALLEARGLAFDVVGVFPDHLRHVPALADRFPDLAFVIDHLAKPPIGRDGWDAWRTQLDAAAERPNVTAKLSGLDTAVGPGWTADDLRPSVEVALAAFGPDRLMFGSDWPVCRSVSTYPEVVRATETLIAELSDDERAAILGGTAMRVYDAA